MNHHHENTKYAADHDQTPRDLMRALVFLAYRAQFGLCENSKSDKEHG